MISIFVLKPISPFRELFALINYLLPPFYVNVLAIFSIIPGVSLPANKDFLGKRFDIKGELSVSAEIKCKI